MRRWKSPQSRVREGRYHFVIGDASLEPHSVNFAKEVELVALSADLRKVGAFVFAA